MPGFDCTRYLPFTPIDKPDRRWPGNTIRKAPVWASVDLRDGNQALLSPMDETRKLRMFDLLVRMGFKEIEAGFPSASRQETAFIRRLIEEKRIPEDVTIQVLTQAREDLIIRSFEVLRGVKRAIMHVYNSLNPIQRRLVFRLDKNGVREIALKGARLIRDIAASYPETEWIFEYSPESFNDTEPEFSLEVCSAVMEVWRPDEGRQVIFNLPASVEMSTPNVFADQVEWFIDHLPGRDQVTVSVHTHNDRGCAVAAAELAVMAGADRVEGTLFGNGERTGNMDILTMAMNLYSRGIDPMLDLSFSGEIISCYTECTGMPVSPRHPWFGEMVFTAFSGSHQDAIRKGMSFYRKNGGKWVVPYLPVDPEDLGKSYVGIVRINSQSGKSGLTHVLERDQGICLPPWLAEEFARVVQKLSEETGGEVPSDMIADLFRKRYLTPPPKRKLDSYRIETAGNILLLEIRMGLGGRHVLRGSGKGIVEALLDSLMKFLDTRVEVVQLSEQALSSGTKASAIAYVRLRSIQTGSEASAAGMGADTTEAVLQAVIQAAFTLAFPSEGI